MKEYKLLWAKNPPDFQLEIDQAAKEGFEPCGQLKIYDKEDSFTDGRPVGEETNFFQLWVKLPKREKEPRIRVVSTDKGKLMLKNAVRRLKYKAKKRKK